MLCIVLATIVQLAIEIRFTHVTFLAAGVNLRERILNLVYIECICVIGKNRAEYLGLVDTRVRP